ncbi:MAG TPA: hypothetical protein VH950_03150 [Gaiellaceae bacterium]
MEIELVPAAEPVQQAAVAAALRAVRGDLDTGRSPYVSCWRRRGLAEAVERDEPEPGYAPSPRSSRGATRA